MEVSINLICSLCGMEIEVEEKHSRFGVIYNAKPCDCVIDEIDELKDEKNELEKELKKYEPFS